MKNKKQILTRTGVLVTTADCVILKIGAYADYDHAALVVHGIRGGQTEHPYVVLYRLEAKDRVQEVVRKALEGNKEFSDPSDAYVVPIIYREATDPRVMWYEV